MKNKGFTLVELLAVIVILAVILLITAPIVLKAIKDSEKSSAISSTGLYIKAVEQSILEYELNNGRSILDGIYNVNDSGNLCLDENCNKILEIGAKNKPKSGIIVIRQGNVSKVVNLDVNDIIVSTNNQGELDTLLTDINYQNGEVVYFDVSKGEGCTKKEYESSLGLYETYIDDELVEVEDYGNSKSGYNGIDNKDENQNSCLKFYVIEDIDETVTMILDHNTTSNIAWYSERDNSNGPQIVIEQLKNDTKSWAGTNTLSNYTYNSPSGEYTDIKGDIFSSDGINYTIDYSNHKARLITANEVALFSDEKTFNETNSVNFSSIDFRGEFSSTSDVTNKIGWLYDRLRYTGIESGMPNIAIYDDYEYGYWTASAVMNSYGRAWYVSAYGILNTNDTCHLSNGIRPVIEVSKKNL